MSVVLKTKREMQKIWEASQVLVDIFEQIPAYIVPERSTQDLADFAEKIILAHGAIPTCKGYGDPPFPGAICVSVNDEVVHGIPHPEHFIKEGDLVTLDMVATLDGYCADAARTYAVGKITAADRQLMEAAEEGFFAGIKEVQVGKRLGDLGHAVQAVAEKYGYGVVQELCGHGIGQEMHEDPNVLNYGKAGHGLRFEPGMVLCCEPMFTAGKRYIEVMDDDWTIVTADGRKSSHYENTFALTDQGVFIFTLTPAERAKYGVPIWKI